eukprot:scaffold234640_cov24-Tisochrysis_lutea.AAC.1
MYRSSYLTCLVPSLRLDLRSPFPAPMSPSSTLLHTRAPLSRSTLLHTRARPLPTSREGDSLTRGGGCLPYAGANRSSRARPTSRLAPRARPRRSTWAPSASRPMRWHTCRRTRFVAVPSHTGSTSLSPSFPLSAPRALLYAQERIAKTLNSFSSFDENARQSTVGLSSTMRTAWQKALGERNNQVRVGSFARPRRRMGREAAHRADPRRS